MSELKAASPEREVEFAIEDGISANGYPTLLRAALENLFSNAWKYTAKKPQTRITLGCISDNRKRYDYHVRDNGVGFDMDYAEKLFVPFPRLHTEREFSGSGIGLATVQRIIHKYGGHIWAEAVAGEGATFFIILP